MLITANTFSKDYSTVNSWHIDKQSDTFTWTLLHVYNFLKYQLVFFSSLIAKQKQRFSIRLEE